MQYSARLLFVLCVCILLAAGCRKDGENNPVNPGNNKPTVLTTITGVVSDENGNPLSGISVSTHGKTAITNQYGLFVVKDVRVPQDRCFILARQDGYFTASRAEVPKANGVTNMRLSMMSNVANYSISASAGGTVAISGGGIVEFPANGFMTESGAPYTGTVKVAARWLNPSSRTFYDFFPGDFTATRTDGSETLLYSYGVLNVELYSSGGSKVKMATGKQATLKYPIPSTMLSGAPGEMPLWYFDEGIGMWKEEGKAVKQGNFYVGEVSHFTPWNCDIPIPTAIVKGYVHCDNGNLSVINQEKLVPNARVQVGQREVVTDENGYYEVRVPAGLEFEISVDASRNMGSRTIMSIPVGPLSSQETFTQNIAIMPCPTYVTGTLTGCDNNPTEGVVQVTSSKGFQYVVVTSGQFRIGVESGAQSILYTMGYSGAVTDPLLIEPIAAGTTRNIGTIQLCREITNNYIDIALDSGVYFKNLALSPDGSMVAVVGNLAVQAVQVYDTQSGALLQTLPIPADVYSYISRIEFSKDNRKLMFCNNEVYPDAEYSLVIWNTSTWQEIGKLAELEGSVFMPDGNSILSIDIKTREIVQTSIPGSTEIKRFSVSAGGARKLYGPRANGTEFVYIDTPEDVSDRRVKYGIWNMNTNTLVRTITTDSFPTPLSPYQPFDENYLAVYSGIGYDAIFYIYDLSNGQQLSKIFLRALARSIPTVRPLSKQYVYQSTLPVGLYNMSDGSLVRFLSVPDNATPSNAELSFCADGSKLAALWFRGTPQYTRCYLRIWNLPQ